MDLQQELGRSSAVTTAWSPIEHDGADSATLDGAEPDVANALGEPRWSSYVDAVRRSDPPARRTVDRVIRGLDVVGSTVGLLVAAPILAAAAVAIRASSPGPALYGQVRVGRDGRSFRCLKLRTMRSDAENQLEELLDRPEYVDQWHRARKLADDPRVTPVGRLLRSTDLDELPQLWNVLRGEMSLVGPRPVPDDEAERYGPALARVLSVRPGMTGLWQVGGRHRVSYDERIALDLRYVERRGIAVNLRLIVRTVGLIALRRNEAS